MATKHHTHTLPGKIFSPTNRPAARNQGNSRLKEARFVSREGGSCRLRSCVGSFVDVCAFLNRAEVFVLESFFLPFLLRSHTILDIFVGVEV